MIETQGPLRLANGDKSFFRHWQDTENDRVVVFLHGMESHSSWFAAVASQLLSKGWDSYAFDRPGWGHSPGVRGHLEDAQRSIHMTLEVIDNLKDQYQQVGLAGLSWGGLLALNVALTRREDLALLCLIAPGLYPRLTALTKIKAWASYATSMGREYRFHLPWPIEAFAYEDDNQAFIAEDPERVTSITAPTCRETLALRQRVFQLVDEQPLPPTLLLMAGRDAIIDNQKTSRRLEKVVDREITYDDMGHSLVLEGPSFVAHDLQKFAQERVTEVESPISQTEGSRGQDSVSPSVSSRRRTPRSRPLADLKPDHR